MLHAMATSEIQRRTIWESPTTRLVKLSGFRTHPNFPYGRRGRRGGAFVRHPQRVLEAVVLHSLAGPFRQGIDTVEGLARYHTSDPRFDAAGKVIGGGRGWPGPAYTFVVPFFPALVDRKLEVYQLWDAEWVTWHAGKHWNGRSLSVGLGGMHDTRHAPKYSAGQARDPDPLQFEATRSLVVDYILPTYGLSQEDVVPHAWAGKPTCPGDVMEAWCAHLRGTDVDWLALERRLWLPPDQRNAPLPALPRGDRRPLDTWKDRQAALVDLGFDVGDAGIDGLFGYYTKSALRAFQRSRGLVVDGIWGPMTERSLRLALARSTTAC